VNGWGRVLLQRSRWVSLPIRMLGLMGRQAADTIGSRCRLLCTYGREGRKGCHGATAGEESLGCTMLGVQACVAGAWCGVSRYTFNMSGNAYQ
jgi:hypothetical protein